MPSKIKRCSSPVKIFLILLLVIPAIEIVIMFLLPLAFPGDDAGHLKDFADAFALALLSAPFLWLLIVRPLKRVAISEISRANARLEDMASTVSEQAEFSSRLVENLILPCFVVGPDHTLTVWNKACEGVTGLKSGNMIGTRKQWKAFYQHEEKTLADMVIDSDDAGGTRSSLQSEGWYANVGGKKRYLVINAVPVHNSKEELVAVIETFEDITGRKNSEEAVRTSEEKFFKAFQSSPDAVVISSKKDGVFLEANESMFKLMGYTREELIGRSSLQLGIWVNPGERDEILRRMDRDGEVRNVEIRVRIKSGEVRTCQWSSAVIDFKKDECLIVTLRDITVQKENDRQLMKNRAELLVKHEQLSALFSQIESAKREWELTLDCIRDMVVLLDRSGKVKRCNRATAEFFGIPYELMPGTDWSGLLQEKGIAEPGPAEGSLELYYQRADRWLFFTRYPYLDHGISIGAVLTIHDTSRRKRAAVALEKAYAELKEIHAQMLQQEKMASLGQMAAGIAHEINNPTGFIISNLGTLRKYLERLVEFMAMQSAKGALANDEELTAARKQLKVDRIIGDIPSLIDESLEGADRMKKIVRDMKRFSRSDDSEPTLSDLKECLESTINIVWNELKYKAVLKKEYGELAPISCYPQQLNQVFMNLLVNAAHAIESQGEIGIRTWQEADAVFIAISDTGSGIPDEIRNRIFEPFFTTKEIGKGTGLGLSISYDIVKKHGGNIWVESAPGRGTTFTIKLPTGA